MSDYQYITETGVIVPDTSDILAEVTADYQAGFGAAFNPAPSTPQGVLIASDANARAEVVSNNAVVANQINPNIAGGVFLAGICMLTGLQAPPATPSTIPGVSMTGQPFFAIPAGVQANTTAGDLFASDAICTLDASGNGTVDFQSVASGPIPAPIGSLNRVVTDVLGWETVNNTQAAVLGVAAISDPELRTLRENTLALQGSSLAEAVTSAVNALSAVRSMKFRENVESTPQVIDGITLAAKSVWACVDGGADDDVANALLTAKSGGCGWNGSDVVPIVDPSSGQTYSVKFDRPTIIPMLARITLRVPASVVNPQQSVAQTIVDYSNGLVTGLQGFIVGGGVSPFEIAGAVTQTYPGTYVQKMEVADSSAIFQTTEYPIALNEKASITFGAIQVEIIS